MTKQENDNKPFVIKIENFQSLGKAELVLDNNLTVVTGKTNSGKSAIVRAIETIIFNNGSDDYIKAGSDGLSIEMDNGKHKAKYVRKVKGKTDKTTYQFDDGEVQQKVGRNQLPEMENFFNIKEVRLQNNQRKRLNFWYQNEWPFLMDATPGQLYEFLSVSSSEKYLEVLKQMFGDIKKEDIEIKTTTSAIDALKKELNHKETIMAQNVGFDMLYSNIMSLQQTATVVDKGLGIISTMDTVQSIANNTKKVIDTKEKALQAINIEYVSNKMKSLIKTSDLLENSFKVLHDLNRVAEHKKYSEKRLLAVTKNFNRTDYLISSLQERFTKIESLNSIVSDAISKGKIVHSVQLAHKEKEEELAKLPKDVLTIEKQIAMQNRLEKCKELSEWLSKRRQDFAVVIAADKEKSAAELRLKNLNEEFEDIDKEFNETKEKLGVCPFCGSAFTSGEHQHIHNQEES